MYPELVSPPKVHVDGQTPGPAASAQPTWPEVGVTHKAFVGDSESPTKVAVPEPEVKVIGPEVKSEVKGNEGPEESAL